MVKQKNLKLNNRVKALVEEYKRKLSWVILSITIFLGLVLFMTTEIIGVESFGARFAETIALTFLSALLIVGTFEYFLKDHYLKIMKLTVKSILDDNIRDGVVLPDVGITYVHNGFPKELFVEKLRTANKVRILQTFIGDLESIQVQLKDFCERGGKLEVALLDPESTAVKLRAEEIPDYDEKKFQRRIADNLEFFIPLIDQGMEVRIHTETPSVSVYWVDNFMLVGNYLYGLHAVQGPQLEVSRGQYFSFIVDHFENTWKHRTKSLPRLEELEKYE